MKVLYDHQSFTGMTHGGVTRYFVELMRAFQQRTDISFELSLKFSNNEYLDGTPFSRHFRFSRFANNFNANRLASQFNRLYSVQQIKSGQFDIFHPTYFHRYFLQSLGQKPLVLTFHDASSEIYRDVYPELGEHLYPIKKALLLRADQVISVSEHTKSDILRFFDIKPEKITVVPLGTPFSNHPPRPIPVETPQHFLLYVGKRALYKNFDSFFEAIQPILVKHTHLNLVCAGGGPFSSTERQRFEIAGLTNRVHYRPVTDGELFYLYQKALALVFPSLNEGFGIPVLEAFSSGCPVILSNRSSLPEVAGEAAVYFDPEQRESIAEAVEKVVDNASLREVLKRKGAERLGRFSCEKTAQQTLEVYRQLV